MPKVQLCTNESRKSSRLQDVTWRSNTERRNLEVGWGGPDYGILIKNRAKGLRDFKLQTNVKLNEEQKYLERCTEGENTCGDWEEKCDHRGDRWKTEGAATLPKWGNSSWFPVWEKNAEMCGWWLRARLTRQVKAPLRSFCWTCRHGGGALWRRGLAVCASVGNWWMSSWAGKSGAPGFSCHTAAV